MPYNQKSQPDGKCYRTACKRPHQFQWNTSTEAYYCCGCKSLITQYPENAHLFEDHRLQEGVKKLSDVLRFGPIRANGNMVYDCNMQLIKLHPMHGLSTTELHGLVQALAEFGTPIYRQDAGGSPTWDYEFPKVVWKSQPNVKLFVVRNEDPHVPSFMVVAQAEGYTASEAHDDWFAYYKDAMEVMKQLAEEPVAV